MPFSCPGIVGFVLFMLGGGHTQKNRILQKRPCLFLGSWHTFTSFQLYLYEFFATIAHTVVGEEGSTNKKKTEGIMDGSHDEIYLEHLSELMKNRQTK